MSDKKKLLVVIAPGHTGNTYNAGAVKGYYESKAVYDLSLYEKAALEKRGIDYRMMILPDHPTPIKLKTHVSDPVPYIIYDSTNETDKNANLTYTEENGKKTGIYIEEGYTLMNRFLGK